MYLSFHLSSIVVAEVPIVAPTGAAAGATATG